MAAFLHLISLRSTPSRHQMLALACAVGTLLQSVLSVTSAQAQTPGERQPVAVIAAPSYQTLLNKADFLGSLMGQPQAGQQLNGMVALFTQGQGLQGLDQTKTWGAIVQTDGLQFQPVVCLPVTNLAATLQLLQQFGLQTSDVGDGITEIEAPNQSLYVKAAGGWAYLAQRAEMLEAPPQNPQQLFQTLTGQYDLGVQLYLPNVPEMYRQIALAQLRAGAEQGLERQPDEDAEVYQARRQATELQIEQFERLLNELDQIRLGLKIDETAGNAFLEATCNALPGTTTAAELGIYQAGKTNFAGFLKEQAALQVNAVIDLPEELLAKYRSQMDKNIASLQQQIDVALSQTTDEEMLNQQEKEVVKAAISSLLESLVATAQTGHTDMVGSVTVSPNSLQVVAGGYALETDKLEEALKGLSTLVQRRTQSGELNWNADSHAGVALHTLAIPLPAGEEGPRQLFGEAIDIAIGIAPKAVYFAAGKECVPLLKQAIDASASQGPLPVKPMQYTISLKPILETAAALDDTLPPAFDMVQAALNQQGEGQDQIQITMASVEDRLQLRVQLGKGVLQAIGVGVAASKAAAMQRDR